MGIRARGPNIYSAPTRDTPIPPQMLPGDFQLNGNHMRILNEDLTPGEWFALARAEQSKPGRPVMQQWALEVSYMQQSVLMGIVRGPDGVEKYHPVKPVLRWYRRCLLLSALDGEVIDNPWDKRGGSFTGPSINQPIDFASTDADGRYAKGFDWEMDMYEKVDMFMATMDQMPIHFFLHMMHAVEIMGYHHSDPRIAMWWNKLYIRMVHAMHLYPESKEQLDTRLGDTREGWLARSDPAITK